MLFGSASQLGFSGLVPHSGCTWWKAQREATSAWKREWFSQAGTDVPELGLAGSCWPDLDHVLFHEPMALACGRSVLIRIWGGHLCPQGEIKAQISVTKRNANGGWAADVSEVH